ncbi:ABC transporter related protein [Rhodomicrobium vannielii ATCC 17100]|uniref:ABC transporter related protein n=1 Tax=Rhodomicrobium vannielii (strain ATCC 17100 / DSM 162 / LMG 4299 / NCIMB 10020 / ATH 3.1.1) TaxID=648757 RepID=E3I830_RHOVT|nr:ATP-binding cassette domain-containing protein [Rhodomicrobium vannielii]ADP71956.1 ABC transporter related protein [Rhodomicrobium vannielii ATCC 17100]
MAAPLLTLQNIALTFGGTPLFDGASLVVSEGDRIAIVGRNGTGKSTLMKIAAGLIEPDSGSRFAQPGAIMRYLPQEPDFGDHATVLSYVESGLGPTDDHYQARLLLGELDLTGEEAPATLSGGEARRAALVRILAANPDVLLLDEPTNHLDIQVIEWLEKRLAAMKSALVIISHDRRFLTNLSRSTVWVDRGTTRTLDFGFGKFEDWRDEFLAQEELDRHKLARKIEREADWLRYGVTARRKRNVRRLGALHSLRDELRTARRAPGAARLEAAEGAQSGKLVIEAEGISKSYGGGKPVVEKFSTRVMRGARIGLAGPNGAGKTTLLKMLIGALEPDEGAVRLGTNLEIAALEQNRDSLKPDMTVADALTGGHGDLVVVNGAARHVASYMQDFLFLPEQVRSPLKVLSGGERARLMLARAFAKPSNLLVLDEPTNDLDLETLDVLEELLNDYGGTIILVSHDRDFLDRVATSMICPDGNGQWIEYAGGYSDTLAQRGGRGFGSEPAKTKSTQEPKLKAAASGGDQPKPKRKLSFNEKHALETLPAKVTALEKQIGTLQAKLTDPNLYAKDRKAFDQATAALAKAQAELTEAENRWLELEILREELGL